MSHITCVLRGSHKHPGILSLGIRNICSFLHSLPSSDAVSSARSTHFHHYLSKLLLILQNPVTYSLLWRAVHESPDSTEPLYTRYCHNGFLLLTGLSLTSLGLEACLNMPSFLFLPCLHTAASYMAHSTCSTSVEKQKH